MENNKQGLLYSCVQQAVISSLGCPFTSYWFTMHLSQHRIWPELFCSEMDMEDFSSEWQITSVFPTPDFQLWHGPSYAIWVFFGVWSTDLKLCTLNTSDEFSSPSEGFSTGKHWQRLEELGGELSTAHTAWKSKEEWWLCSALRKGHCKIN